MSRYAFVTIHLRSSLAIERTSTFESFIANRKAQGTMMLEAESAAVVKSIDTRKAIE